MQNLTRRQLNDSLVQQEKNNTLQAMAVQILEQK